MIASADIIVIGAGITGLATAHALHRRGIDVQVLEASPRPGGAIQTEQRDGFTLEHGPFSVLVRSDEFRDALSELQLLPVEVDASAARKRYVLKRGKLHLVPTSPLGLMRTSLLSPAGKMRAAKGIFRSSPRSGDEEPTIAQVAARRLGREAAEWLAGPAAVGIFAAEADELSFDACFPTLARADREASSITAMMKSLRRERPPASGRPPQRRTMITFEAGLASLIDALAGDLHGRVHLSERVMRIERSDHGIRIDHGSASVTARNVVLALPAMVSSKLLSSIVPDASAALGGFRHADLGVVHLAFKRSDVDHPLEGFGFLVPRNEPGCEPVLGTIWPGGVFPHHVPAEHVMVRAMIGGTRWPGALDADDDQLIDRTMTQLRPLLGLRGEPMFTAVSRWPASVPVYAPGHAARVQRVLDAVKGVPGLWVAGNWNGGPGVNDRVDSGRRLAARIAEAITAPASARRYRTESAA